MNSGILGFLLKCDFVSKSFDAGVSQFPKLVIAVTRNLVAGLIIMIRSSYGCSVDEKLSCYYSCLAKIFQSVPQWIKIFLQVHCC